MPANLTVEELEILKREKLFFCPHCMERVIFRRGERKVPHFAHQQNRNCTYFSDGETEQHIHGKLQLYELFKRTTDKVLLEGYIADIKQRPDLLVYSKQKQYAIEFQCSTIPLSLITERNDGYSTKSIIPIWILLSPSWKIGTPQVIKLTTFQQFFISSNSLITYNPASKSFYYLSNLLHMQSTTYIGKVDELPNHLQTWPLATVKKISFPDFQKYLNLYFKKRASYLQNLYLYNKKGIQNYFLRICYYLGVQPTSIPLFIGIPSQYANYFTEHACEWQLAWLDYLTRHSVMLEDIQEKHCILFLKEYKRSLEDVDKKSIAIQTYSSMLTDTLIKKGGNFLFWEVNICEMEKLLYKQFLGQ